MGPPTSLTLQSQVPNNTTRLDRQVREYLRTTGQIIELKEFDYQIYLLQYFYILYN